MNEFRALIVDRIALAALLLAWAEAAFAVVRRPPGMEIAPFFVIATLATLIFAIVQWTLTTNGTRLNVSFSIPDDKLPEIAPLQSAFQRLLRMVLMIGFAALPAAIALSPPDGTPVAVIAVLAALIAGPILLVTWFMRRVRRIAEAPDDANGSVAEWNR